jgi:hypothetical protein
MAVIEAAETPSPGIDTRPESAFYKPLIRPTDSTRVPRDREPR